VYDGKLRRRIEKDFTWSGSAWTQTNEIHFVYDGNLVIQERNTNNQPVVTYTRGNDLSGKLQGAGGIGGLLNRTANGQGSAANTNAYYHADGNGNITMLVDANQNMVAKYLYDPYGSMLAQCGSLADANSYRFSSKEWNANSGLYYYLYRLYDPNLQRWLNRDPLVEGGFEAIRNTLPKLVLLFASAVERFQGPNLYNYVKNKPISWFDPFGLQCDGAYCLGPTPIPLPPLSFGCKWNCRLAAAVCTIGCAGLTEGLGAAACGSACTLAEQACEDYCDKDKDKCKK